MVSINYSAREVCCKIVYYGPGLSGKTTNLQYVHSKVPNNTRGNLISLATEADRTLYFDFLPINIGTINGFAAKFQLYTVPGQVYYNATRKLVLRGVDGLVFVADSQPDKMDENIESLANLEENLREYGYDINDLPLVIQYNKRDLPGVLPVEKLDAELNSQGRPTYEASATIGNGVFDTLKLIIKLVLEKAKSSGGPTPIAAARPAVSQPEASTTEPAATPPPSASLTSPKASDPEVPKVRGETAGEPAPAPPPSPKVDERQTVAAKTRPPVPEQDKVTAPVGVGAPEGVVSPEKQDQGSYRPYPGGEGAAVEEETKAASEPPGDSQPVEPKTPAEPQSPEPEADVKPQPPVNAGAPRMAPSVGTMSTKSETKKKRGFFKRLFGIK